MNKILYLVENQTSAQFRYQVANVIEAAQKNCAFKVDFLETAKATPSNFKDVDLLVFLRQTSKNAAIPNLVKSAKQRGIKVVFTLDDLIFDYRDIPLLIYSTNSRNVPYWVGYFWGIRRVAKLADGFLATNTFLAKKLERSFKKPVAVIPNSLSLKQIQVSEKLCKTKQPRQGFTIGYFSGSPTHAKDFRLIEPDIIKFLEKHDDAKLKIVGYMDFSAGAKKLLENKRIEFQEPVDYLKLQELMSEVNVNIAPLVDNDFTNCKSELKFFEAAIVETPTIASPTFAFKNAIKDGETGFLAKPGEWFDKLEYIYRHRAEAEKIAKAAKRYCLNTYYGKNLLAQVEQAYDTFLN